MYPTSIRLDQDLKTWLEETSKNFNVSTGFIVRNALRQYRSECGTDRLELIRNKRETLTT